MVIVGSGVNISEGVTITGVAIGSFVDGIGRLVQAVNSMNIAAIEET
jgi:hypothetical protein